MLTVGSIGVLASLERAGEANLDQLQEQAVAAVLLGRFDPREFDLAGLVRRGLVPEGREAAARIEALHPELTRLSTAGLTFDVTRDRMSVSARAEPFVRLMDLVKKASQQVDEGLLGVIFVYAFQFRVAGLRQQTILGRQLAPLEAWGETGRLFEGEGSMPGSGLSSLTLQRTMLEGSPGTLKITVQPAHPANSATGVSMQIERSFARTDASGDGSWFAQACIDQYDSTLRMCKGIVKGMIDHARAL